MILRHLKSETVTVSDVCLVTCNPTFYFSLFISIMIKPQKSSTNTGAQQRPKRRLGQSYDGQTDRQ